MKNQFDDLKIYLKKNCSVFNEKQIVSEAKHKLNDMLRESECDDPNTVAAIRKYMSMGEVQENLLLSHCVELFGLKDFHYGIVGSSVKSHNIVESQGIFTTPSKGVKIEVEQHRSLNKDGLSDMKQFINERMNNSSFVAMVDMIMAAHDIDPKTLKENACMDRRDYSRATNCKKGKVSKRTVWQFIIGLKCNMEEADKLLASAGYVRLNTPLDLTMEFFILNKNYDIFAINEALDEVFDLYKGDTRPFTL